MKYIKLLGTGFSGSTYLVKKNGKEYALKIQHILEKDFLNRKSQIWNEIKFYKYVSDYYPLFKKFYSYKIITDCEFKKNNKSIGLTVGNDFKNEYKKLQESKYCIEYLTSYENNTLSNILNKLTIKQIYSLILQLLCGIKILQKKKYTHNDFNYYNITYNNTKKKYIIIKINDKKYKIPIYDYIYTIIDYGNVKIQPKKFNKSQDINNLINNIEKYWIEYCKIIKKEDINYMKENSNNINKLIKYFQKNS
jgi:serine/threonine protein kinase